MDIAIMAPLSSGNAGLGLGLGNVQARSLGNTTVVVPQIPLGEGKTLQILALTFAIISVTSSLLAFYWFMKMRRSFRHDLIMLLIQSDMFKALWFMIYPIVIFTHGHVSSSSTFCQVSGFFLALGVESSDIAVLMIAVHSALYIFRPKASGEGGLYPYRYIAYAIWVIFPIMMASIAFQNDQNAYVAQGTYCYLPVRPFWYRLALAWIPRYMIFLIILGIYLSIYYYVKYKQIGLEDGDEKPRAPTTTHQKGPTVPPTPTLACHGLITDSQLAIENKTVERRESDATLARYKMSRSRSIADVGAHRFMLASLIVGSDDSSIPPSEPSSFADSFTGPSTPTPLPRTVTVEGETPATISSYTPSHSRATSWRDGFVRKLQPSRSASSKRSVIDLFTILRRHPDRTASTPVSQLQLMNSRGQTYMEAEILRARDQVRRQLRFLFIYPLVYIGMWMIPFVSHVLQYEDKYALHPSFALLCITTISICSQAAIDAWLFSVREKPWQHIPGSKGGFWESLKFWHGWTGHGQRRITMRGVGKSRDAMVMDARAAYQRRDEELAQRRAEVESPGLSTPQSRRERSWWDVDGAVMSPLAEELDPLDRIEGFQFEGGATLQATTTNVSKAGSEKGPLS